VPFVMMMLVGAGLAVAVIVLLFIEQPLRIEGADGSPIRAYAFVGAG
jgi:kynurenine formamidase